MEVQTIVGQMLMLFFIMIIGYIANRCKIINKEANKMLSKFIINISLSALIIASVMNVENKVSMTELGMLLLFAFLTYALLGGIGFLTPRLLFAKKADRGIYTMMSMFGNVAFMGFPVLIAVWGQEAIFYAALFNIPFNLLLYSLGILLLSSEEKVKFTKAAFLNAPLISSLAALIIYILPVQFPAFLAEGTALLGDMTIPAAMIVIGSSLAEISVKEVFNDFRVYIVSLVKLVVCPVAVWFLLKWFVTNPMILTVAVVTTAMPMATNITMLSIEYGGNEALASKGIFISTVLSLVTIPLVLSLVL